MTKRILPVLLLSCMLFNDILNFVMGKQPIISPIPDNYKPPTYAVHPAEDAYKQAIEKGFQHWGSPPAATLSGTYAKAPAAAPIFKKYPFLLPAQSIAETSGGKKQKFTNNPQNWGIVPQAKGNYSPPSAEQNIMDAMSGIGGTRSGESPDRMRSQGYYDKFRKSGDLMDFATNYAPPGENDTEKYVNDLMSIMSVFESMMPKNLTNR